MLEDPENSQPISFVSVPGMIMKQIILGDILKHMENKEVIRDSEHGFTKGKFCLNDLMAFNDGLNASVDQVPSNIMYLDFCKAFDMIHHNSHAAKLETYRFDG